MLKSTKYRYFYMKNASNYPLLMAELKKVLKRKKIKYSDLAAEMEMSESSIKRLMSADDGSLSKIEAICDVVGISFFDLALLTKEDKPRNFYLTKKQDSFFAKNTHYFYFFSLIYEQRFTIEEVKKQYKLTDKSLMKYLKKLEELEMLERHPHNRIKWLIQGSTALPDLTDLGKHLMSTSIRNFSDIILTEGRLKSELEGKEGSFRISELNLKKETVHRYRMELDELAEKYAKEADREERIYGKEGLELFTTLVSVLPLRLYSEDIPNLK